MTDAKRKPTPQLHPLMKTGLTVMALSALWWLGYYGQWHGALGDMALKFNCLASDSPDCQSIRDTIGNSLVPMYQPGLWWGGIMCSLVGWFLARFAGRQA